MEVKGFFHDLFLRFLFEYLKRNEVRYVLTFKVYKKNKPSKKFYWNFGKFGLILKVKHKKFIQPNRSLFFKILNQKPKNPNGTINMIKKLEKFFFL